MLIIQQSEFVFRRYYELKTQSAAAEAGAPEAAATTLVVPLEMRKGAHRTSAMLTNRGYLDVNGCIPQMCILDSGAIKPMFSKAFAIAVGINIQTLTPGRPFLTAGGIMAVGRVIIPYRV